MNFVNTLRRYARQQFDGMDLWMRTAKWSMARLGRTLRGIDGPAAREQASTVVFRGRTDEGSLAEGIEHAELVSACANRVGYAHELAREAPVCSAIKHIEAAEVGESSQVKDADSCQRVESPNP